MLWKSMETYVEETMKLIAQIEVAMIPPTPASKRAWTTSKTLPKITNKKLHASLSGPTAPIEVAGTEQTHADPHALKMFQKKTKSSVRWYMLTAHKEVDMILVIHAVKHAWKKKMLLYVQLCLLIAHKGVDTIVLTRVNKPACLQNVRQ